ncbi:MarR family winged helix-turn-helix transcriptional regulator [Afifella sp. H1R]|uniref:MarR family winged helix-turn-helix transcriptional regulator n=1 Tax=unclassified Afifella TaxID=2624128 RepID=UPI001F1EA1ED|nr:MarR family transcriptional regulator [Afifella sp. H1R]MCF1503921.1 MarR family transcriptional regulator [Afifella sp. H1R]
MSKSADQTKLPEIGEGKRGEGGYLGYLLRQAAAAHRLRMDRALADLEVTPPQFAVMTMVKAYPGQSNADIARMALLTPQTTNVIVANLERAGHIQRRPHEVHRRILRIDLTPSGNDLLQACRSRVQAVEAELAQGFSEETTAEIRRWLVAVSRLNAG